VSNQIAVIPLGAESDAKNVNSDPDKGIESNLDGDFIKDRLHDSVKCAVKNHVVTLTGKADSQSKRAGAEAVASAVLNVQVVNELQVKGQKVRASQQVWRGRNARYSFLGWVGSPSWSLTNSTLGRGVSRHRHTRSSGGLGDGCPEPLLGAGVKKELPCHSGFTLSVS
jgi:hypothetical protein